MRNMRLSVVMLVAAASIAFGGVASAQVQFNALGHGTHNTPHMNHRYCKLSQYGWDCRDRERQRAIRQQRMQRRMGGTRPCGRI